MAVEVSKRFQKYPQVALEVSKLFQYALQVALDVSKRFQKWLQVTVDVSKWFQECLQTSQGEALRCLGEEKPRFRSRGFSLSQIKFLRFQAEKKRAMRDFTRIARPFV